MSWVQDPNYTPSVPIPSIGRSAGGMALSLGLFSNVRYQIVGGIDRYLFDHCNFLLSYLSLSTLFRTFSTIIGQPTRLHLQVRQCIVSFIHGTFASRHFACHLIPIAKYILLVPLLCRFCHKASCALNCFANRVEQGMPTVVPTRPERQLLQARNSVVPVDSGRFLRPTKGKAGSSGNGADPQRKGKKRPSRSKGFQMTATRSPQPAL